MIDEGEVSEFFGHAELPFVMEGIVVEGEQRGRELGFPTANLIPPAEMALPSHGVYAGRVTLSDRPGRWIGAVNIGVRPQFESVFGLLVEVHLLDFSGDLYGRRLRLELKARLRDELLFASVDALVAQIEQDLVACRAAIRS